MSLEDALQQLVDELEAKALRISEAHRPYFALEQGDDCFVLTVQTDNGGGPMTCHLVENRLAIERSPDGSLTLSRNAEHIGPSAEQWTEDDAVAWLRSEALATLPRAGDLLG
jgi:hypothetical protein